MSVSSQRETEVDKKHMNKCKKSMRINIPTWDNLWGREVRQFWALRCHLPIRLWASSHQKEWVGGSLPQLTQVLLLLLHHWVCFRACKKAASYLWSTPWRPAYFKSCSLSLWQRCSSSTLRKHSWCLPELCLSRLIKGGQMKLPMTQYISEKAPGSQG